MTTSSARPGRTRRLRQKAKPFWMCPRCGRQFVSANKVFRDYRHVFRLTQPADLDDDLVALLHEGYMLGCQPLAGR